MRTVRLSNTIASLLMLLLLNAAFVYSEPLSQSQASSDSLLGQAHALHSRGRYSQAVSMFLRAGADTGAPHDRHVLGLCYGAMNDAERAFKFLSEASILDSTALHYRFQLARFLLQASRSHDAQHQLEKIVSRDTSYVPALVSLGTIYYDTRAFQKSADMFARAIAFNQRDYLSHYYLGTALVSLKNQDAAQESFERCLVLNADYVPALNVLASIHYSRKQFPKALELYQRAWELRPFNAEIANKVGLCRRNLDQDSTSLEAFRCAAVNDSLNAQYLGNLGLAYFRLRKFDSSASTYQRALAIEKDNSIFFYNLSLSLQKMDSMEAAIGALKSAIAATKPEETASFYVALGNIYYLMTRYADAIAPYQSALRMDSTNREAQFYLAACFDNIKKTAEAVRHYRRYVAMSEGVLSERERVAWTKRRLESMTRPRGARRS